MNSKLKGILSALVIVLSISIVIIVAFSNKELGNAWDTIRQMDLIWLAGLLLCWASYAVFEAMGTWSYLRSQGYKIHLPRVIGVALIGLYYSNITPSAAGGQPMQVNSLRKAGIPVGYGTTAVTIRFVCNQFMICLVSLVLAIVHRDFVHQQLGGAMWAARIGWGINFLAVPLVTLAAFKRSWIQKLVEKLIALFAKMHLVREPEKQIEKATEVLNTYHTALIDLIHCPGQILLQLLYSALSLLGLTFSIVFTYHAFGLRGTPWNQLLTLSCLLFVSASYTPLPGASGAQEGGFLLYFNGIFTDGTIGLALLVWRFFTYYLFLIVGMFTVLNEKLLVRRERHRRKKAAAAEVPEETAEAEGEEETEATAEPEQPEKDPLAEAEKKTSAK